MKKILLIEDERIFANIVKELIQGEGFSCDVAYSASEAERYFDRLGSEIQVVILDLMMTRTGSFAANPRQQETGDDIYERIRKQAPNLTVVIMTAKTADSLLKRYFTDKNTKVFFKPINPGDVEQLVKYLKSV